MGALLQSLKILFLFLTTIVVIYMFLRDARKGINVYLIFMCICGFLGFARPIYAEAIILPLCILLGKGDRQASVSYPWLILLVISAVFTIIYGNEFWETTDELFLFGLMMFAFARKLFPDEKQSLVVLMLLWAYAFSRTLWMLRTGGADAMAVSDISEDSTRLIVASTGLEVDAVVDPNYFGYVTGLGAVLSFLYYRFHREFNRILGYKFLQKKYLPLIVLLVGCLEVFFTVRGLSRGMLVALLAAAVAYLALQRKLWHLVVTVVIFGAVSLWLSHTQLFSLYLERFAADDDGAGRFEIWGFVWELMQEKGPLFMLFGGGFHYPWWSYFNVTQGLSFFSTHNSWITLLLSCGFLGAAILIRTMSRSVRAGLKHPSAVNQTKLVMLAYVVIASSTIEPMTYTWGWIPLVVACSIWSDKTSRVRI